MKKRYIWGFISLIIIYISLVFILPADPNTLERFNISALQAKFLGLTVAVPLSLIYLLALYGIVMLKSFANTVTKTIEGPAYHHIADGLLIFAYSLPLMSIISSLTNYIVLRNSDLLAELVVTRNYLRVIVTVIAFTLIAQGAEILVRTVKGRTTFEKPHISLIGAIALSSLYTWLIITRHHVPGLAVPTYYLSDWIVLTTQAIPLVFVWCRGLRAVYHLYVYREKLGGKIYKRAWELLAKGIAYTIFVAILMQFIVTASNRLVALNLTPVLILVYLLVVGYAVSFLYIASGAKKLKMIEEV